jgi:hypothetical protein
MVGKVRLMRGTWAAGGRIVLRRRAALAAVMVGCLTAWLSQPLAAADISPKKPAPATPRAAEQFDITGHWVSIISEDWIYRMLVGPKGDVGSIPVNDAGRKAAAAWDPAKDAAEPGACKAYGAAGLIRQPGRLAIAWADDRTLRIDFDAGRQTRLLHFSDQLPTSGYSSSEPPSNFAVPDVPGEPTLQGYSVAAWHKQAQGLGTGPYASTTVAAKGGSLAVITRHLAPGYLQSNGIPYSSQAILKEFFDVVRIPSGIEYLIVTSIVEDPTYLNQPWVTSTQFKREPDGSKWDPAGC